MDHPTISSFRYCPSCGKEPINKTSNKKLHCQFCDFQLFLNPAIAVSLILFNEKDELLLATRAKNPGINLLDLPGGFVDPFETAEEAAKREIFEELGFRLEGMTYIGSEYNIYPYKQVTYQTVDIGFASNINSNTRFTIDAELKDVNWTHYSKIKIENIAFQSAVKFITKFIKQKHNIDIR